MHRDTNTQKKARNLTEENNGDGSWEILRQLDVEGAEFWKRGSYTVIELQKSE